MSWALDACDEETIAAVEKVIAAFSQPFIATVVHDLLRAEAVSSTSTNYPEAAFGWMNDSVRLGSQLARVCLSGAWGERVRLAVFHHPGNTVSRRCLKELVEAAETQAHVRPRRRTEKFQQRLATQEESITRLRRLLDQQEMKPVVCNRPARSTVGLLIVAMPSID